MIIMVNKPLPCIICKCELQSARKESPLPVGANVFSSIGHYGATFYDPILNNDHIEVNICTECLIEASEAGLIKEITIERPKTIITSRIYKTDNLMKIFSKENDETT